MKPVGPTGEAPDRDDTVVPPSNRSFGVLFAVVFAAAGLAPAWNGRPVRAWALAVSALFGLAALLRPAVLEPLNRLWSRVGVLMHAVVNPVIMAALFYLAVTPFGVVRRLLRKGVTRRLRPDSSASTYWVDRAGQPPSRMDRQF